MKRLSPLFAGFALFLCNARADAEVGADKALSTMKVADGLQVELFAAEPMFSNPTSMDIDHKGRVWVCEAINYRRRLRGQPPLRKEGDRIVSCEEVFADALRNGEFTIEEFDDLSGSERHKILEVYAQDEARRELQEAGE